MVKKKTVELDLPAAALKRTPNCDIKTTVDSVFMLPVSPLVQSNYYSFATFMMFVRLFIKAQSLENIRKEL